MKINLSKTKEIVFRRPSPYSHLTPCPLPSVDIVKEHTLLGVAFHDSFKFCKHVDEILAICNKRSYLLRQLRDQGMPICKLDIIFNGLIVSKITYALAVWGGFLPQSDLDRLNSFFSKARRWNICTRALRIEELLEHIDLNFWKHSSAQSLFTFSPASPTPWNYDP